MKKSRDYTNPTLPSGEGPIQSHGDLEQMHSHSSMIPSVSRSTSAEDYHYDYYGGVARGRTPSATAASNYDMQANGNHLMGPIPPSSATYNPMVGAAPQYAHPYGSAAHSTASMHSLPGATAGAHMHGVHPQVSSQANLSMHQNMSMMPSSNGPVLLVSNLNENMTTPESLFTLFGVYGDVHRVKILFNKKDSALIQFATAQQAAIAHQNLDHVTIFGKQIKLSFSKHQFVQMPKDGASDMGLTKDFTNSPLHRFKKPGSKNYNNIHPPSSVLHLSNIPNEVGEEALATIFSQYGTIKRFKFFEKDRKMALIEMGTVEEAIAALINTHNYQLADSMHLRVSFSKSKV